MKIGQAQSIEVWEAGLYPAEVVDVIETESTYPGSEGKARLRFVFRVSDPTGGWTDVWHFTGATLSKHPAATLRPLVKVLRPDLNLDDPDLEVDLGHPEGQDASEDDALIGARCQVILGINEERGRNQVEKVMPAEAVKQAAAAPARAPVAARTRTPF